MHKSMRLNFYASKYMFKYFRKYLLSRNKMSLADVLDGMRERMVVLTSHATIFQLYT